MQRGTTSEDPVHDLMDFIPSGWNRDLMHMVGCFYARQITPLKSREWDNDWDKFIQAMDECKDSEWLDIRRAGATLIHALCGQVLSGDYQSPFARTQPAYQMD